ncbi:MAG: hypothetical protein FWC43_11355 [Planctomycetaceae bacterium]|nr:hypothetical protein [Planctomycetaceae bacterium]
MKWFIPCPACKKRGTFDNGKKLTLKSDFNGHELNETWLYFVCRHCGKIQKEANGVWYDVDTKEWEMAKNNTVIEIQLPGQHKAKPAKNQKRNDSAKTMTP